MIITAFEWHYYLTIPLSNKFNSNTLVESFEELNYFTGFTTSGASTLHDCYFKKLGLKNRVRVEGYYSMNVYPLTVYNMPNLTYIGNDHDMLIGINSSITNTVSVAFYLPKLEHIFNPRYYWYGKGELRWMVIGTNNGGKVVTCTNNNYMNYMRKTPKGIFVPDELVDDYKNTAPWSSSTIIHGISEFKTLVTDVTGEELPSEE